MKITILTLFPELIQGFVEHGLLQKAQESNTVEIVVRNLRDWATDKHKTADDAPYGGGPGMVIKGDLCLKALEEIAPPQTTGISTHQRIILTTPDGQRFDQTYAEELAKSDELVILAGRYEGIDERVREHVTDEISIGDFVLFGGELPALLITEAVARLIPGVVGDPDSVKDESFSNGRLDYPHFTRPPILEGKEVPPILQSGDHSAIARFRKKESLRRTLTRRPDLFLEHPPTREENTLITEMLQEWTPLPASGELAPNSAD